MNNKRKHHADLLIVIALFAIYAICAIMLCAIGAGVYRNITAIMANDYDVRTGVLYVAEKVRQNEVGGAVRVDKLNGSDALVLAEQHGRGYGYETWVYVANGQLCEQMIAKGAAVELTSGQVIMPMQSLQASLSKDRLLTVSLLTLADVKTAITLDIKVNNQPFYYEDKDSASSGSDSDGSDGDDGDEPSTVTMSLPGGEG